MSKLIEPHGKRLVNRVLNSKHKEKFASEAKELTSINVDKNKQIEIENIAKGLLSPLEGFIGQEDLENITNKNRLTNGVPWTIPIVFDVTKEKAQDLTEGETIAINNSNGNIFALLEVKEKYSYNKKVTAEKIFGTSDVEHPGVKDWINQKDILIAGNVDLIKSDPVFPDYNLTPQETRIVFKERGWSTVVAFQTRNPIHRGHEYLQKTALETVDGLFINPIIGKKKPDDFSDEAILNSYKFMTENFYVKNRIVMSILPSKMYYAGPKEAILHAIIRKNFGCSHFIVGRDHAGVGNYYGTYDAQKFFLEFDEKELGIKPIPFEHSFFCKKCDSIVTSKTCPHSQDFHVPPSGTKIRECISNGELPPKEIMRPEIADLLINHKPTFQKDIK